jgi:tRNA(Ile)-lysidine synthase
MNSAFLDAKVCQNKIAIRKWKHGDRFAPMGLNGHSMKLADFWINKKIPQRLRRRLPLVLSGEHVIWIPGFQPSFLSKITDSTLDVLVIKVKEKI